MNEVENILLNLSSGLLPENLQPDEVKLLEEKYGSNWFEELGYTTDKYKFPICKRSLFNENP